MSETKIDDGHLRVVVNKLMDKAGSDKRLTPRLLREKAEMLMKLESGALKCKRARIMVMIYDWWSKNVEPLPKLGGSAKDDSTDVDPDLAMLRNLAKYAKAVGKGPNYFKDLGGVEKPNADKAVVLRKRLLDDGVNVPHNPSSAEIEAARKAHELKKEADDIDPNLIIEGKRRGGDSGSAPASTKDGLGTNPTVKVKSEVRTEKSSSSSASVGQKRFAPSAADEEEEADF